MTSAHHMLHRIVLASVDSTNKYVEEHKAHLTPPALVTAIHQRRGKGQGENRWDSKEGDLTFTLYTTLGNINIASFFILSQIVSLEIIYLLKDNGIQARIKWPNDILVGLEKICGILIQTHVANGAFSNASIGIGLNITQRGVSPKHYNPSATSLSNLGLLNAENIDPIKMSEELALRIITAINNYSSKDAQRIRADYWQHLFRNQGLHPFLINKERKNARIVAVCDNGQLHIQDESAKEYHCGFKEVKFIFDI